MTTNRSSLAAVAALSLLALGACGSSSGSSSTTLAPATTTAAAPTTAAATETSAATATTAAATATTAAAGGAVTGSIDVSDQTSDGKSLTIADVSITGASGFIAIHQDAAGAPGPVVGHVAIPTGDSKNVKVTLDSAVTTGKFWPMLHLDAGTIGTYEFPGPDGPVKDAAGIVMKQITLTVG
jgi:hypothetical protein